MTSKHWCNLSISSDEMELHSELNPQAMKTSVFLTFICLTVLVVPSQSYYARPGGTFVLKVPSTYDVVVNGRNLKVICKLIMYQGDSWIPKHCGAFLVQTGTRKSVDLIDEALIEPTTQQDLFT